ncbi:hypothetical protein DPEC_G00107780 [Dallia pectoralis]|uniref:Uncharacterized protein n=1 Tax=Dallia pectoralis TaxID=75939 RepID=A0ACC2GS69_DALPE|nr:hypothetical protein DPEC_G00107780 [Dallia pectoralis]
MQLLSNQLRLKGQSVDRAEREPGEREGLRVALMTLFVPSGSKACKGGGCVATLELGNVFVGKREGERGTDPLDRGRRQTSFSLNGPVVKRS